MAFYITKVNKTDCVLWITTWHRAVHSPAFFISVHLFSAGQRVLAVKVRWSDPKKLFSFSLSSRVGIPPGSLLDNINSVLLVSQLKKCLHKKLHMGLTFDGLPRTVAVLYALFSTHARTQTHTRTKNHNKSKTAAIHKRALAKVNGCIIWLSNIPIIIGYKAACTATS